MYYVRNMRSTLLAVLVAALIPACIVGTGDVTGSGSGSNPAGGGGGGGTGGGGGGGTGGGGGGGSSMPTPMVGITADTPSLTSDLGVQNVINLTVSGSMGFAGDVSLTAAVVDAGGSRMTDWVATLDTATVTLPQDGSQTVKLTVSAPGDVANLNGKIVVTGTSTAADAVANISATLKPQLDVMFLLDPNDSTKCAYPAGVNQAYHLKVGRTIAVYNPSASLGMIVHVDSGISGFPHESTSPPGTAPGAAYMGTVTAAGTSGSFYCHSGIGGTLSDGASSGNQHPVLEVVP